MCALGFLFGSSEIQASDEATAEFLRQVPSARAAGMGGVFTATGADPSALFGNPALFPWVRGTSFAGERTFSVLDTGSNLLAGAGPVGERWGLGAGVLTFDGGRGLETFESGGAFEREGENFVHGEGAAGAGAGFRLGVLSLGLSLHEVYAASDVAGGQTPGGILGAALRLGSGFQAAAAFRGWGGSLGGRRLSQEGTFGLALEKVTPLGLEFILGAEARIPEGGRPRGGLGFESLRSQGPYRLALRAGGRWGDETGGLPLSLGGSLGRQTGRAVLWLDYAFEPAGVLGSVHRVGLRTSFDRPSPPPTAWLSAPLSFLAGKEVASLRPSAGGGRIRRWELVLFAPDGKKVARWQGRRRPPPEVPWAGEDTPAGLYDAELLVVDDKGRAARSPLRAIRLVRETSPPPGQEKPQPSIAWRIPYVIPADFLFTTGSHYLLPEAVSNLERVVQTIEGSYRGQELWVFGHTDNQALKEGSPYKDNQELSALRAQEVKRYLERRLGYPEGTIQVWGYGDSQPLADNANLEGQSRNRRVEVVIVTTQFIPLSQALIAAATAETRGDSAQALALLRAALAAAPERPEVSRQLGALLYGLGARREAFDLLRRALSLNPGDEVLRDWLQRAESGR